MVGRRGGGKYLEVVFGEVVVQVFDAETGAWLGSAVEGRCEYEGFGERWGGGRLHVGFGRIAVCSSIAGCAYGAAGLGIVNPCS